MSAAAPRRVALAAAVAVALLSGCAPQFFEAGRPNPRPGIQQGEWAAMRSQATRRARLYDQFSQRAVVTATYLGAPERLARVNRLADWLGWTPEEKARQLTAELEEAEKYEDFVVALYTEDRKSNDLDAKASVWRLALRIDGGDLVTRDATVLDVTATVTNLFPYVGHFDTVYRVRFNKVPGSPLSGRPFTFELASALGKLDMTFGDGTFGPDRPPGTPLPE